MGKQPPPGACPALSEPLFRAIVGGLFLEARVPNGSIIDAGAHMGFESCYYAGMSPLRTVHAVEPLSSNVAFMKRQYSRSHPNLTPLLGGLGSSTRTLELGRDARRVAGVQLSLTRSSYKALDRSPVDDGDRQRGRTVTVRRVDDLFTQRWAGERLGFMHLDVQGGEQDVLRGAMATLMRDQPLFSVELDVQQNHSYSKELLSIIHDAGYRAVLIEEVCGVNLDCRNILATFPLRPFCRLAHPQSRLRCGPSRARRRGLSIAARLPMLRARPRVLPERTQLLHRQRRGQLASIAQLAAAQERRPMERISAKRSGS